MEYALYKGDTLLQIGTVDELAKFKNVKRETILFYTSRAYKERTSEKNGLRVIKMD